MASRRKTTSPEEAEVVSPSALQASSPMGMDDVDEDGVPLQKDPYFLREDKDVEFYSSGCTLIDLVNSGGWPLGRMINIVGDKSSGKTLLAIEACANFVQKFPDEASGKIWYNESEAAFDPGYAEALGLPLNRVTFVGSDVEPESTRVDGASDTVEGLGTHLEKVLEFHTKHKIPNGLYVIDSMDAFSDEAELKATMSDGTFGGKKPKLIGQMFRRLVRRLEEANISLIIISQVRDKIGVTFGETKTRSGGKALDFYASQILWLAEIGKEKKTVMNVERPIGVNVKCNNKKNKVGVAFRQAEYFVLFGFGIDDLTSNVNWLLEEVKDVEWLQANLDISKATKNRRLGTLFRKPDDEYRATCKLVADRVRDRWKAIEKELMPKRKKYS